MTDKSVHDNDTDNNKELTNDVEEKLNKLISEVDSKLDTCPICRHAPIPPLKLECDHIICKGCYDSMITRNGPQRMTCPVCADPICSYPTNALEIEELIKGVIGVNMYNKKVETFAKKHNKFMEKKYQKFDFSKMYSPEELKLIENEEKEIEVESKRCKEYEKKYTKYVRMRKVIDISSLLMFVLSIVCLLGIALTNEHYSKFAVLFIFVGVGSTFIIFDKYFRIIELGRILKPPERHVQGHGRFGFRNDRLANVVGTVGIGGDNDYDY